MWKGRGGEGREERERGEREDEGMGWRMGMKASGSEVCVVFERACVIPIASLRLHTISLISSSAGIPLSSPRSSALCEKREGKGGEGRRYISHSSME